MHNKRLILHIEGLNGVTSVAAARADDNRTFRDQEHAMNENLVRQAHEMLDAATHARLPENVQAFAEESLTKSRGAYEKVSALAKDNAKVVEELLVAAQAKAKTIGEKVVDNAVTNTEAAFAAAQAIARAKTLPEAARLQLEFVQTQLAVAGNRRRTSSPCRPRPPGRPTRRSTRPPRRASRR